jgi:hypothetical protein
MHLAIRRLWRRSVPPTQADKIPVPTVVISKHAHSVLCTAVSNRGPATKNGAKLDTGRPPRSYASSIRDKSYRIG